MAVKLGWEQFAMVFKTSWSCELHILLSTVLGECTDDQDSVLALQIVHINDQALMQVVKEMVGSVLGKY